LHRLYQQVKGDSDVSEVISEGKIITGKMKKDILTQLTNEAYQRYQDSLRQRGLDNIVTTQAFDLYRWLIDVERQVN